jgi:hypothetical protein
MVTAAARFLLLPALLLPASALAAGQPKGQVIDRVVCSAEPSQSYALYLPSNYSPERAWPILYCLDPLARGRVPVERFQEGAEKHGYIVAGSHNSRNGPIAPALEALRWMWRDTHETLNIDDRRAYLAGMSGGARDATAFLATGAFAGVIAQAAGFSGPEVPSDFALPFFGSAGVDDFNYAEMRHVDRELEARGTPHRLVIFAGPHGWAPSSVCAEALAWLDLTAMRAGTKPIDKNLIRALFQQDTERARSADAADDIASACLRYRALAADFRGWEDTAPFERKAAELKESKRYRKAVKSEESAAARQRELLTKIFSRETDLANPGSRQEALASVRDSIAVLRTTAASARDSEHRRVARRVLREAVVRAWGQASGLREKNDYSGAARSLELAALIEPDDPELLYNLAGLCALSGDKGRALSYLKRAFEKGFRDVARLGADPSFNSVREKPEFRAMVGQGSR